MFKEYLINSFLTDELKIKKLLIIDNEVCNTNTSYMDLFNYLNNDHSLPIFNDSIVIDGNSYILMDILKTFYDKEKEVKIITEENKAINMYLIDIYNTFIEDYNLEKHLDIEIL